MFTGTIRPLQKEDENAVEEIFDLYWTDSFRKHLSERLHSPELTWLIAEENGEVVGVVSTRSAPESMRTFAETENVVELYVIAAKYKGRGVGSALRNYILKTARDAGFTEVVFYSGETHQDSWAFHDDSEFKRAGESVAPNGERGQIWLAKL